MCIWRIDLGPATRARFPRLTARYVRLIWKRVSLFEFDLCSPVYNSTPTPGRPTSVQLYITFPPRSFTPHRSRVGFIFSVFSWPILASNGLHFRPLTFNEICSSQARHRNCINDLYFAPSSTRGLIISDKAGCRAPLCKRFRTRQQRRL